MLVYRYYQTAKPFVLKYEDLKDFCIKLYKVTGNQLLNKLEKIHYRNQCATATGKNSTNWKFRRNDF